MESQGLTELRVSADAAFSYNYDLPNDAAYSESCVAIALAVKLSVEADGRVSREVRDGYLYLTGEWNDGDVVSFDFAMPVRMLAANPLVREDVGRVAFTRGPVTFCAEEKDNGANLHLLHADVDEVLADPSSVKVEEFAFEAGTSGIDDQGQGEVDPVSRRMVRLEVPAWREPVPAGVSAESPAFAPLYADYAPVRREPVTATLIPYFAWANRGENEMTVFLRA
nr:beta-L-arabinofuranosidase domain-containing protein [Bifidobacterium hapali]